MRRFLALIQLTNIVQQIVLAAAVHIGILRTLGSALCALLCSNKGFLLNYTAVKRAATCRQAAIGTAAVRRLLHGGNLERLLRTTESTCRILCCAKEAFLAQCMVLALVTQLYAPFHVQ